ncbi:hypothetical protein QTP88_010114 [Uroleucon formosanum]
MRYVYSLANAMTYVTVGSALVSEFIGRQPVRFPRMGPCRQSNNKALHPQPTTAQVLEKYLASKKAKLESPSDHIGAFFVAMEATTRRLPPILQIEAKAKISALLPDLKMRAYLSNENTNNIASSLQSTSTNEYQVCITPTASPSRPVDFSNHGHRVSYKNVTGYSTASSVTENPSSGHEDFFEVNSVDNNYYNL